ncbi:MAG: DNA helicase RecQ [Lachnospiraceae bacterium]|nr:DNA helicase RecQ [Lachnospiraceae bacterium]
MNQSEVLKKYFGYETFREGQEMLIGSILEGRDVLGIMPTGSGKSLCYQIPALMLSGITLVISPLISLMKDQVRALNEAGIHAAYINSSLTEKQISMALSNASRGQYKIIYVAPERLETPMFQQFVMCVDISMVTVDEAHCISQWGQDFRPSYLNIVKLIELLPKRPVISAFTATATEQVKEDILCVLKLEQPNVLVTGFNRENLYFEVNEDKKKNGALIKYIQEHKGESGIIYCATRKNVELVFELLKGQGISAARYHAGLSNEERKNSQDAFIYDEVQIIVATNAFGMGIDKSNVRYVIHYNMPQSMENYYQEAGRAGRDGEKADCILLYSPQDVMINQFLIENKEVRADIGGEESMELREQDMKRLRQMTYYCTTKECLRTYILRYFGEKTFCNCGNCSNCLMEYEEIDVTDMCRNIVNCIRETRGRFGMNVIVGTLRGEKKAKLISYGLDALSCFGLEQGTPEKQLKQVINELIMREYLYVTRDKYAIVKLRREAMDILQGTSVVKIKIPKLTSKEQELADREAAANNASKKKSKWNRTSDILNSRGLELFEQLKVLRLTLAKEAGMPPYIICTDKTLIDMCIKLPFTREEMLNVNGVGENKYEKYGVRFLQVIQEFTSGNREKLYYEEMKDSENTEPDTAREKLGRIKNRKEDFVLTEEMAGQVVFVPECQITALTNQLNELRDESVMKKTSGAAIMRKLKAENYLEENYEKGIWKKTVYEKGKELGIALKPQISAKGTEYEVFVFSEQAQRSIVEKLLGEWKHLE